MRYGCYPERSFSLIVHERNSVIQIVPRVLELCASDCVTPYPLYPFHASRTLSPGHVLSRFDRSLAPSCSLFIFLSRPLKKGSNFRNFFSSSSPESFLVIPCPPFMNKCNFHLRSYFSTRVIP